MKRTIAIVIVIMMCVSILAACGGKEEAQTPVAPTQSPEPPPEPTPEPTPEPIKDAVLEGFYTLIKYEAGDVDLLEIVEDSGESTLYVYIEFRSDGTAYFFFMDEGGDITYKVSGDQVTLIFDDDDEYNELEGIIEDDTITFEQDGLVMVYKLNPDFQPGEISMDEDIIPPGYYTLVDVKADDGEDLMPTVIEWEVETGISVIDANHIKILTGNRFEQCVMEFDEDYVVTCGVIYMEGDTIIYQCQFEDYDDEIFEVELNGDRLIVYAADMIWVYERNDNYFGRD